MSYLWWIGKVVVIIMILDDEGFCRKAGSTARDPISGGTANPLGPSRRSPGSRGAISRLQESFGAIPRLPRSCFLFDGFTHSGG